MKKNRTEISLIFGFSTVLLLLGAVVLIAISEISHLHEELEEVILEQQSEDQHIHRMYNAARERIISMQKMVTMDDPFDIDEEWMRFKSHASVFIQSRNSLLQADLSSTERELLDLQGKYTTLSVPYQEQVVRLIQQGQQQEAIDVLLNQAIPAQEEVLDTLSTFLDYQNNKNYNTLNHASNNYISTRLYLIILAGLAFIIATLISTLAIRRTNRTEESLFNEKERAHITLKSIGDAIITTNAHGIIELINPVAENLLDTTAKDVIGQGIDGVFTITDEAHRALTNPAIEAIDIASITASHKPALFSREDGTEFMIEYTAAPILNKENKVSGSILIFRDVTEMHALSNQLRYQARHDALTGLYNRREFESMLEKRLAQTRSSNIEHSFMYIDLDQFKIVNDTCGHSAGDELLKQLSAILSAEIRSSDTLARLGGDEFGLILENCPLHKAKRLAEEILASIKDFRFIWDNKSFEIGASIGLVPINDSSGTISAVFSAGDAACYIAKDKGRNRVHIYHANDRDMEKHHGEMQWVQVISSALEEDRFQLYFQAIVPVSDDKQTIHYEILIRMIEQDGSLIPPMAFIPAAERYNLMPNIDRWVIRNTFRFIARIKDNINVRETMFCINLSGQSLCDKNFLGFVTDMFEEEDIDPRLVCFEITETAAIANLTIAMRIIGVLTGMGCHFSLDDFGSGLSSFAYLKNMKVDYLKIDGTFVRDISHDPVDRAFVESINQIGHLLNLKTIAEFVENEETIKILKEINVNYAQGFGIHKPIPMSQLEEMLNKNEPFVRLNS